MTNKASSIKPAAELSFGSVRTTLLESVLSRLHISTNRGVAQANAAFAFSFIAWAVLDTFISHELIALPIGGTLALLFYAFAVKLSQGEEIPARWLRISGCTALGLAGVSGLDFWGSLMSPVDVACVIWSSAFVGGFGLYAYHALWTRRDG